jgi:glycosyltransferase involved in cell wall biosynthesis
MTTVSSRVDRPLLSVIIPAGGRNTLRNTLRRPCREPDVEVIVVTDGHQPAVEEICDDFPVVFIEGPRTGSWGNSQRELGMRHATGRYLMFIDDDDVYTRSAFAHVRDAIRTHPGRIIVFRMNVHFLRLTAFGTILWAEPQIVHMNIGTPMFVIPNAEGKVGSWTSRDRYESDLDFLMECVALQGAPVWDARVIALVRQPARLLTRFRSRVAVRTRLRKLRNL